MIRIYAKVFDPASVLSKSQTQVNIEEIKDHHSLFLKLVNSSVRLEPAALKLIKS